MSSAKRVPTPDVIDLMSDNLRNHIVEVIWPNPYGFRDIADALEAQRDQLQLSRIEVGLLKSEAEIARDQLRQAREIIDALMCEEYQTCTWCDDAREWLAANPAPAATKE